ncbi:TetR/AcrR family transcriptional regulator [Nocardia sp. NPDC051030]|uniref:TetR/AcrR family transcriptional regulator n=1 Tax=Nocardia sp. NPDC051030 TaxID=3155162 RepID=UPI0034434C44
MAGVPGQGRKFDADKALEQAMLAFWNHGYEGTSIAMLTKSMGINAPSLYAAFGGKEDVFFAAVDHYNATHGSFMKRAFDEELHAAPLIRRLLFDAAEAYAPERCPGGCLIISSAVRVSATNQHIADRLHAMRDANIASLAQRLAADRSAALIPADIDPAATAEFIGAVIQGMSQRARDGVPGSTLRQVAEMAYRAVELPPGTPASGSLELVAAPGIA